MPYRTFSLNEVAVYLHMTRTDVETLVQHWEIPVERQAKRLLFRKKDIDAWASQRILGFSRKHLTTYHKQTSALTRSLSHQALIVAELARLEAIEPALTSKTKPSVLRDMVALADHTGLVCNPHDFLQSLEDRERLCSTALPDGIALLHPRNHDPHLFVDSFIGIGRTIHPVPFGAPDGNRTDLFFLICCQDDRLHLHVLARLCMMSKQTKVLIQLRVAESAEAMVAVLRRAEEEVVNQI
ncbi:MAG: PTS sugar transporter subunit IIA [Kiritimatiellae bacterium]|nr:PTS sugar transporter subunit IIA [Kiritimatiellia bacterium]